MTILDREPQADPVLEIAQYRGGGSGFVARRAVPVGGTVAVLAGVPAAGPSTYTIQVSRTRHVDAHEVRLLNHSCVPSTFVDTVAGRIVALRPIRAGEELTFYYPSTEWRMVSPFDCRCGFDDVCLGRVTGAEALPVSLLSRYALNEHITEQLAERDGLATATG